MTYLEVNVAEIKTTIHSSDNPDQLYIMAIIRCPSTKFMSGITGPVILMVKLPSFDQTEVLSQTLDLIIKHLPINTENVSEAVENVTAHEDDTHIFPKKCWTASTQSIIPHDYENWTKIETVEDDMYLDMSIDLNEPTKTSLPALDMKPIACFNNLISSVQGLREKKLFPDEFNLCIEKVVEIETEICDTLRESLFINYINIFISKFDDLEKAYIECFDFIASYATDPTALQSLLMEQIYSHKILLTSKQNCFPTKDVQIPQLRGRIDQELSNISTRNILAKVNYEKCNFLKFGVIGCQDELLFCDNSKTEKMFAILMADALLLLTHPEHRYATHVLAEKIESVSNVNEQNLSFVISEKIEAGHREYQLIAPGLSTFKKWISHISRIAARNKEKYF